MCLFMAIMVCRIGPDMITVLGMRLPPLVQRLLGWGG